MWGGKKILQKLYKTGKLYKIVLAKNLKKEKFTNFLSLLLKKLFLMGLFIYLKGGGG